MSERPHPTAATGRSPEVRADWTSYGIRWYRADTDPRPDFDHSAQALLYRTATGEPLFTVVTHGGFPSEGAFTLIAEAPRIRDEVDGRVQRENRMLTDALALLRAAHAHGITPELHTRIAAFLEVEDA